MPNELQTLKTIFDSNNIPVSIEWLEACISWCKSEILNSSYSLDELKSAIHDQWLNLDLRDIETSALPPGLSEKKFFILDGNFSLQVMKVVDISKPKYWQLQQIRKENILTRPSGNEVRETIGSAKRVLQLTLTDGVQHVEAMEYKTIQLLNINLTPGVKIRLSGPITIRRGRLLLEEQNIRILGGEVQELLVTNAAENVLASALNLPINENPNIIDAKSLTVEQESENVVNINHSRNTITSTKSKGPTIKNVNNQRNYSVAPTIRQDEFPTDEDLKLIMIEDNQSNGMSIIPQAKSQVANNTNVINQNKYSVAPPVCQDEFPTDEDLELMMIEQDQSNFPNMNNKSIIPPVKSKFPNTKNVNNQRNNIVAPPVRQDEFPTDEDLELMMIEVQAHNRSRLNKTPDLFEDDFDADKLDQLIENTNTVKKVPNSSNKIETNEATSEPPKKKTVLEADILESNSFSDFVNEDLFADLELDNPNKKDGVVITLLELKGRIADGCVGLFKIKSKFKAIERKVTVQDEEYRADMRIEDDSGDLVCRVHSNVISKWAGLTPVEMLNLRKKILAGQVEYKNKVQSVLQVIMRKILEVDNVMDIESKGNGSLPIINEIFY